MAASAPAIGAHVDSTDPVTAGTQTGAAAVQFFLADPQGWKAPKPPTFADELAASGLTIYVHAPYVLNLASTNNRIRIPSRKLLTQHAEAAAAIGARGLIVHGGHLAKGEDPEVGLENWRKVFARAAEDSGHPGGFPLPILIENTAGGDNAMARRFDRLARLWDAVGEFGPGFCLDTCHAYAGGEELDDIVERVRAITGRVDLVHANNSRDSFDSGADRHANFDAGTIDAQLIAHVCQQAGTDVIVETPGGPDGQGADIAYLREQLG